MDVLCGGCGRTLSIADGEVVHDLPCPHCGRLIRMSAMAEGPAAEDERLLAPLAAEDDLADEFLTKAKLALKKKLLVVCGACGAKLTVHQRLAGGPARCPSCGKQIDVPSINEDGENIPRRALTVDLAVEPAPAPVEAPPPLPRRRRAVARRKRSTLSAALLLGGFGAGIVGIFLGYMLWGRPADTPPEDGQRPVDMPDGPTRRDPWASVSVEPKPTPLPAPLPAPTPTPSAFPTPPGPRAPMLGVVKARLTLLADDSLIPAPPGKAFLTAAVRVGAGDDPVELDSADAVLHAAGAEHVALGVPGPTGAFSVGARRLRVTIPPTASRVETFLFVVPADLAGGAVNVAGVGEVPLGDLARAPAPKREDLAGTYGETARFLKPAFDDPIMENVRAAPRQEIVIAAGKDGLDVAIRPTSIRGRATPDGAGAYTAALTDGPNKLTGRLRFLPDGRRVVLYLADAPYHQVVYERRPAGHALVAPTP